MSRFEFNPTFLDGVYTIKPKPITDQRGYFERYFCAQDFKEINLCKPIAQINHSKTTKKGSIRGLHYQTPPFSETKIVRCIRGQILDVAIDIRQDSPTFLKYFAIELNETNGLSLYIPEGFAHGFQALSDDCEILYLLTTPFTPEADSTLNPLDPTIAISWQEAIGDISPKDKNAPYISPTFQGVRI
ncbi:dTDP-4-dehydrorhamnose 3,5-epimerase [Helicobacter sp. 12S02634-8]|uniref:dTDP-4-dehydrorhamnose 3,5-epimerase n=1 Tax=Helicobacter sp. 12S02634-8 TaxID=1476199 RepID=UPI000BA7499B|nr:dTDP-4-dehydrorhamnose 3,5-epimerase [Helicobacter sp. 12S02634-8]PAF47036.1 dTDP-4-dehydrorhamnose 3,5-epimerase [Helicobacter sp. 12S02634-8]